MPIIGSLKELPIGQRVVAPFLSDSNGINHANIPFLVLRRVTIVEYINWVETTGGKFVEKPDPNDFYYEISMD